MKTALMQWGANVHTENLGFKIVNKVLEFLEFKHSWKLKKRDIKYRFCTISVTTIKVIVFNCMFCTDLLHWKYNLWKKNSSITHIIEVFSLVVSIFGHHCMLLCQCATFNASSTAWPILSTIWHKFTLPKTNLSRLFCLHKNIPKVSGRRPML